MQANDLTCQKWVGILHSVAVDRRFLYAMHQYQYEIEFLKNFKVNQQQQNVQVEPKNSTLAFF
jgi:hypothetical protein